MCVLRFEEKPKKFNEGSARLIDVLRKQNTEKPERAAGTPDRAPCFFSAGREK